jgi:hypothetical protein
MPFRSDRVCSLRRSPQTGRLHLDQGGHRRIHQGIVEPARQGQGYSSQLCRAYTRLPGLAITECQLGLPDLPFVARPQCPGPILTPLVVATMGEESMKTFGVTTSIGRAGVSLAS